MLAAGLFSLVGPAGGIGGARASGDARTLTFFHTHTKETATVTFWRNGRFDEAGLDQLNWLLRDWRVNERAKMDPHLFPVLWEIYQESGSRAPINIISAYRSPTTNAMLRKRSKGVSEHSQHMLGKAMDIRLPDVDTARLRAVAMRMQYGGVGYYSSSNFVHVDVGNVRAWPRMSQDQLARLFPDGKTVHLPPNGKPLARYEEAKAEVLARKQALASVAGSANPLGGLLGSLFRKEPRPAEGNRLPDNAVALVSLPSDKTIVASAAFTAPLPPPRPVEPVMALQVAALAAEAETGTIVQTSAEWDRESLTPESRLLFLSASMSAVTGTAETRPPSGSGPRWLDRELLVARSADPMLAQTFSAPTGHVAGTRRFAGPAVRNLTNWRVAYGPS